MMSTDPSRAQEIFAAALAFADEAQRRLYLDRTCADAPELRQEVESLLAAHVAAGSFLSNPALPPTQLAVTGAAIDSSPDITHPPSPIGTVRYFGDYELLEEIARGGMGVVFKARQVSLNRIVAVKMILAGHFASETEIKRFHTEAEAAANLQHPNIVAIHEVGVHAGQHYFSMDYVAGQNLHEVAGGRPMDLAQAAGWVKVLAEAVHYAHQRGTLHRDLKPQNVLIDPDGQPHITDFGLAKRIERDSGLTRSGAVLGSPSYMAPEQAAGRQDWVGPATDVYSLGAVLYELLTGRPPFQGETVMATLVKVLDEAPASPRKVNPNVPLDLETICLKCLEKRMERRYHSARQLGEELQRYLNHEPILARPASGLRKSWSWLQRHPWVVSGVATLLVMASVFLAYGFWQQKNYMAWQQANPGEVFTFGVQSILLTGLFVTGALGLATLHEQRKFRQRFKRWKQEGVPLTRGLLLARSGLGLALTIYGLVGLLKVIEIECWLVNPSRGFQMLLFLISVLPVLGIWTGANHLWQTVGLHESAIFGEAAQKRVAKEVAEWLEFERLRRTGHLSRKWLWITTVAGPPFLGSGFFFLVILIQGDVPLLDVFIEEALGSLLLIAVFFLYRVCKRYGCENPLLALACFALWISSWALLMRGFAPIVWWSKEVSIDLLCVCLAGYFLPLVFDIWRKQKQGLGSSQGKGRQVQLPSVPSTWQFVNFAGFEVEYFFLVLGYVLLFILGWLTVENWRVFLAAEHCRLQLALNWELVKTQGLNPPGLSGETGFLKAPLFKKSSLQLHLNTDLVKRLEQIRRFRKLYLEPVEWGDFRCGTRPDWSSIRDYTWFVEQRQAPKSKEPAADMLASLQEFEPELEELHQAAQPPFLSFDPDDKAINALIHNLVWHARAELAVGHSSLAFRDFEALTKLSNDPDALVQLFWEGWIAQSWSPVELAGFAADFKQSNFLAERQRRIYREALEDRVRSFHKLLFQVIPWPPYWRSELASYQRYLEFNHLYSVTKQRVYLSRVVEYTRGELNERQIHTILLYRGYYPHLSGFLPMPTKQQTYVNLALIVCALESYRLANGAYPDTLSSLEPAFLKRVPHDITTGEPLKYRRTDDGRFLLYSVGWNGKDDGGIIAPPGKESTEGDWVWFSTAQDAR